jgi:hypothetical protein
MGRTKNELNRKNKLLQRKLREEILKSNKSKKV